MSITYTASSLEDIAQAFDRRADQAATKAAHAATRPAARAYTAEGRAWVEAAEILRETEIKDVLLDALEFYANGIGHTEIDDGGAVARTAILKARGGVA